MLKSIRDNIQGTAAKVIVVVLCIPFVLYGVDFFLTGDRDTTVASVNGDSIGEQELRQAIALQRQQVLNMLGDDADPRMLEEENLRAPALQSLLTERILQQHARQLRMGMPDSLVNQTIVQMPQFQEEGRFSQDRYRRVLRMQGMSPSLFRELLRTEMLADHLQRGIAGTAFLSEREQQEAIRLLEQRRSFHYVRIPASEFEDEVAIEEADIVAYHEAHADQFQTPEAVRISYIELREQDFYAEVNEASLRAAYEREVEGRREREELRAAHILVDAGRDDSTERLEEISTALEEGMPFAEVAERYSDDPGSARQGGDLGFTGGDTFPRAFERALAELEVGEVSEPVETEAGIHIIKLVERSEAETPSFEERRADIERRLQSREARPELVSAVDRLRDLAFNAANLQRPAEELDLEVRETDWLTPDSDHRLMQHPQVRDAAFDEELREEGYNSDVFEVDDHHYVVIHHEDYRAPETLPLSEVRDEIVERLTRERAAELADQRASEMERHLREGEQSLEELAGEWGHDWQVAVRSARQHSGADSRVWRAAFAMPKPSEERLGVVSDTVIDDNGDRIVVQLTAVHDGDPTALSRERRQDLLNSVLRAQAQLDFSSYFNELRRKAQIEIN